MNSTTVRFVDEHLNEVDSAGPGITPVETGTIRHWRNGDRDLVEFEKYGHRPWMVAISRRSWGCTRARSIGSFATHDCCTSMTPSSSVICFTSSAAQRI